MPPRAKKTVPPPALSSTSSSLSSAPDLADSDAEPSIVANGAGRARSKIIQDSIDDTKSGLGKRKRTVTATKVATPTKRVKRDPKAAQVAATEGRKEIEHTATSSAGEKTSERPSKSRKGAVNGKTAKAPQPEAEVVKSSRGHSKARKSATKGVKAENLEAPGLTSEGAASPTLKSTSRSKKAAPKSDEAKEEESDAEKPIRAKKKRKTKEEKDLEAMPIATRTTGLKMFIGAHVSAAKGVQNAVTNCVYIGGNAFALFLKSQRKWENPPLQDEHMTQFKSACTEHKFDAGSHVLPHGSYLVNLAQKDPDKAKQAYDAFLDDLHRCDKLGIKLYNFHPGNTGPSPRPEAIARIADRLNDAHRCSKTVKTVLENMAAGGNVIGTTFEDLRDIIALVKDKSRVGVCLDTCHAFAAGYDLRTPESFKSVLEDFDNIVGMSNLCALHVNDSKAPFGSHRDLHQNIGLGFLGLRAFHNVMNEPRFHGLPLILETPIDVKTVDDKGKEKESEDKAIWAMEIKMLESFVGMDAESETFRTLERELADQGAEERRKFQDQYERKVEKDRVKAERSGKRKKKVGQDASEGRRDESGDGLSSDDDGGVS